MTSNTLADRLERNSILLAPVINHRGQRLYKLPFVTLKQKEVIIAALRGQDQAIEASKHPLESAFREGFVFGQKAVRETRADSYADVAWDKSAAKAALASMGEGDG